jgi:hypothetical protein
VHLELFASDATIHVHGRVRLDFFCHWLMQPTCVGASGRRCFHGLMPLTPSLMLHLLASLRVAHTLSEPELAAVVAVAVQGCAGTGYDVECVGAMLHECPVFSPCLFHGARDLSCIFCSCAVAFPGTAVLSVHVQHGCLGLCLQFVHVGWCFVVLCKMMCVGLTWYGRTSIRAPYGVLSGRRQLILQWGACCIGCRAGILITHE